MIPLSFSKELKSTILKYDLDEEDLFQKLELVGLDPNQVNINFVSSDEEGNNIKLSVIIEKGLKYNINVKTRTYAQNIVLNRLKLLWKKFPDLRFGQLVCNISSFYDSNKDPFYINDSNFIEGMEQMEKAITANREVENVN